MPKRVIVSSLSLPGAPRHFLIHASEASAAVPAAPPEPGQWHQGAWCFCRSEAEARERLAEIGITGAAADEQIGFATQHAAAWKPEHITAIGYRNANAQEVVRKTDAFGTVAGQRVFILRCGACGQEYGTNGSDIPDRRCPACQDGEPGIAA